MPICTPQPRPAWATKSEPLSFRWWPTIPSTGYGLPDGGGARKFRFARPGGGKSGGYRVVTAFCGPDTPVFLITVFAKGEKDNLTRSEAQQLNVLVTRLCATYVKDEKQ